MPDERTPARLQIAADLSGQILDRYVKSPLTEKERAEIQDAMRIALAVAYEDGKTGIEWKPEVPIVVAPTR